MPIVTARIKIKGKHYEISVDLDEALKIKESSGNLNSALQSNAIFYDLKKGTNASESDLLEAFGTTKLQEIAEKIIKSGEIQKTQEFRDTERQDKIKQIIQLILQNASDQNGNPYTKERIQNAVQQIHFNFDNRPAEQQMPELLKKLRTILPIKIETNRIKLTIPAQFTGQIYGLINNYKESEEWLSNGSLQITINLPAGMQLDFYDKINSITHGAVQSEELQQES